MTTYRTSDIARWGTGKGSDLTPTEVDTNFWDIVQRLVSVELALPGTEVAQIEAFSVIGTQFYVHMSDGTQLGPYDLPLATFRSRGAWAPGTLYEVYDTLDQGGALYMVLINHTSEATFDPGANDGAGHDYYGLMLSTPASVIPAGGATAMVLTKASGADYATTWEYPLPSGGAAGTALVKVNATNQNVAWQPVAANKVSFTPTAPMVSTNVQDAIDEISAGGGGGDGGGGGGGAAVDITFNPDPAPTLTSTNVQDALVELSEQINDQPITVGRQTIWVPATSIVPRLTNGPAPNVIEMSSSKNVVATLDFDKSAVEYAQFDLIFPKSWGRTNISFVPLWSHASVAAPYGVVWKLDATEIASSGIPGGALDRSFGTPGISISVGGTGDDLVVGPETDSFLPGGNTAGVVLHQMRIWRDTAHASDTLDVDARLHGVVVYYYTNAATDD